MIRPQAPLLVLVLVHALGLTACQVIVPLAAPMVLVSEIPLDPLQIPRAPLPPAEREGGKVVLVIPADVRSASVPVRPESGMRTVIVRVGAVVDQAVRTSFEGVLRDGPWPGELPPASPGADAIVKIEAVRLTYRERRLRSEWKGGELIQTYESQATLAIDLKLSDGAGRFVQSRTYEDNDGRFVWTIPSEASVPELKWLELHLHQTAGRLAQQAAVDLHQWLRAERMKPRSL